MEKIRLRYISSRITLKKLEKLLHSKDQLSEGLNIIDFEQLKVENQTLTEKIEEKNESIYKLKLKLTQYVHVSYITRRLLLIV